jgi:hypothetical protein
LIKIAHRGNVNGPSDRENEPSYLLEAIAQGYDVEVDLWVIDDVLWLGHDQPQYQIGDGFSAEGFLPKIADKAWVHCKNKEALTYGNENPWNLRYFWHESDKYTLTSSGQVWVYPGEPVPDGAIVVDLDLSNLERYKYMAYAVCTDYPSKLGD